MPINLTKITLQTFLAWKKQKLKEKEEIILREEERKKAEFKAGRHIGLSGRDMFTFQPELADEDEMEEGEVTYDYYSRECDDNDESENNVRYVDLTLESLSCKATEVDGTGTVASLRHWEENEMTNSDRNEESEATGGDCIVVPIDEHLFEDDDLQELEDDLHELKC